MRDIDLIKLNKRRLLITLLINDCTKSEMDILNNLLAEPDLKETNDKDQATAKQPAKITENIETCVTIE